MFHDFIVADLIAVPDFSLGAMENWGLIMYRTQFLLYDDIVSTEQDRMDVAIVIAHELAHQVLQLGTAVFCGRICVES